MDFHGLKRKELQALCKKHGIPANLKNSEMADHLSSILKEENPVKRGRSCLKNFSVDGDAEVSESKEPKRVKFSPQNETFVFEKTDPRQLRSMVRKERAFEKSQLEQKPVLVGAIVDDSGDNNVDLGKVSKRNLRRKSVSGDSIAVLDVDKPVERVSRRKSVLPDPSPIDDTENDVQVDKPVKRITRRMSVVPKSDVDKVDVPAKTVSIVPHPSAVIESENVEVDEGVKRVPSVASQSDVGKVDQPAKRVSRRKSVVPKSDVDKVDVPVKTVSIVPHPSAVLDSENVEVEEAAKKVPSVASQSDVGKVDQPAKRVSRRKSVVPKSDVDKVDVPAKTVSIVPHPSAVLDNENVEVDEAAKRVPSIASQSDVGKVDQPAKRVSRRKSVVPDPSAILDTEDAVEVNIPVKRVSRRMSVSVKPNVDKPDKPVKTVLRKKSLVDKPIAAVDTKVVDEVEKFAGRRKISVVKADEVSNFEVVDNVEKPIQRLLRRKSVVAMPTGVVDTGFSVGMDKAVQRPSKRKCVLPKDNAVFNPETLNEVEEPAYNGKRDQAEEVVLSPCGVNKVGRETVEVVDRPPDVLVGLVADNDLVTDIPENDDGGGMQADGVETNSSLRHVKNANARDGTKTSKGQKIEDDLTLDENNAQGKSPEMPLDIKEPELDVSNPETLNELEEPAYNGKRDQAEEVVPSPCGVNKVGREAVEEVDRPRDDLVGLVADNDIVTDLLENDDDGGMQADGVETKSTLRHVKNANARDGTMTSKGQKIEDDLTLDENNAQGKSPEMPLDIKEPELDEKEVENCMEAFGVLPYNSANCLEEMDVTDKAPEIGVGAFETPINNGSLMIQTSGEHLGENSMQANKVEESQETSMQANKVDESQETSMHKITVADKISDQGPASAPPSNLTIHNCGTLSASMIEKNSAGESTGNCSLKSSIPESSNVHDAGEKQSSCLAETRDNGIYDSTKGVECYNIKDDVIVGQKIGCEDSPRPSNSSKIENTADKGDIDFAAVTFGTSDIQSTKQDETDGSVGLREMVSEEEVVFGPVASTETDIQPPIVVDGMTYAANASPATINKVMEAKDIDRDAALGNQQVNSGAKVAEDYCLFRSSSKDDGEGGAEPSSINTFLLRLESQVDDTMKVLFAPMIEREDCDQETLQGDIASCGRMNILTEENIFEIVEERTDMDNDKILDGEGDDLINCSEDKAMKYEKAAKDTEQDALDSSKREDTSVVLSGLLDTDDDMDNDKMLDGEGDDLINCSEDKAIKYEKAAKDTEQDALDSSKKDDTFVVLSGLLDTDDDMDNDKILDGEGDDLINCSEDNAMTYEKAAKDTEQDVLDSSKGEDTFVVVSGLILDTNDDMKSISNMSDALHPGSAVCSHDVANTCIEVCEDITAADAIDIQSDQDFHLKADDDKSPDRSTIPHKETLQPLEYLCNNFLTPLCSTEEKNSKGTPSGALTCSADDANLDCAATGIKPEEALCSNESKSEFLVSEEDIGIHAKCKDEQPEVVTWPTEDINVSDKLDAQAYSVAKEVEILAQEPQHIDEAEVASTPGNESPGYIKCNELDEVLGMEFDCQSKSVGSTQKEFKNVPHPIGSVEVVKQGATVHEEENLKTSNGRLSSQITFPMTLPEGSKSDYEDEITKVCLVEDTDPGYIADGSATNDGVSQLEMDERSDSLKKSGIFLHENVASEFDGNLQSIVVNYLSLDICARDSADVHATVCEIQSDSLQLVDKKCHKTLDNATIGDTEGLCSSEPMPLENVEEIKGDMVDADFEPLIGIVPQAQEREETEDIVSKEQIDNDMNAGNVKGEEGVIEGNIGCDMEVTEVDNCREGSDDIAPSTEILHSLPSSISEDYVATNDIYEDSINLEVGNELNVNEDFNIELVDGNVDSIEKDFCMSEKDPPAVEEGSDKFETLPYTISATNSIPEHIVFREGRSPAYKDDIRELDSAGCSRDAEDDKGDGDIKSNVESSIFSESEIDLFWKEMEKDDVKTLQPDVSDASFSVNEYDIANVEIDCEGQERVRDSVGEDGNNEKSRNVEEYENPCPFDANNLGKVVERNEDLVSVDKVLMSSMVSKKNRRSILIHGTPKKPALFVHDMKENPPAQKRVHTVHATVMKPNLKRKALDDIAK